MKVYLKILLAVLVLGILFCLLFFKQDIFGSDKHFSYIDTEYLTRIEIESDTLKTVLEKTDNNWLINGEHIADKDMIDNIQILISKLKIEYPLAKIYDATITDSFIMSKGMNIRLYNGASIKKSYYLLCTNSLDCIGLMDGKKQAYYLYMPGYDVDICKYVSANPAFWLNNVVFSYYPKDIVSVKVENTEQPAESFKITRDTANKIKLFDASGLNEITSLDTMAVKRYLSYFNSVTFDRYVDMSEQEKSETYRNNFAAYVLTIETKTGKEIYKVFYIPVDDNVVDAYGKPLKYNRQHFYLSINNGKDVVMASWINFDILLKNLSDFVDK